MLAAVLILDIQPSPRLDVKCCRKVFHSHRIHQTRIAGEVTKPAIPITVYTLDVKL